VQFKSKVLQSHTLHVHLFVRIIIHRRFGPPGGKIYPSHGLYRYISSHKVIFLLFFFSSLPFVRSSIGPYFSLFLLACCCMHSLTRLPILACFFPPMDTTLIPVDIQIPSALLHFTQVHHILIPSYKISDKDLIPLLPSTHQHLHSNKYSQSGLRLPNLT
jgi:hypothetical protein